MSLARCYVCFGLPVVCKRKGGVGEGEGGGHLAMMISLHN